MKSHSVLISPRHRKYFFGVNSQTNNNSLLFIVENLVVIGAVVSQIGQYQIWNAVSNKATNDVVSTLAQLFQRKLQAAPIRPALTDNTVTLALAYLAIKRRNIGTAKK